jgi:hypothetical protein
MIVLIVAACLRQQSRPTLQFEEVGQSWDLTGNTPKHASPWVRRVRGRACYLQQWIWATR